MAGSGPRYQQYGSRIMIGVSAAVAAVFVLRAAMSATGSSSLSGPVWTTVNLLVAIAAVIRCFDRVVVTPEGLTIVRVGIPRRLAPRQIHRLVLMEKSAKWSRLYAETVDGKQTTVAAERRDAHGELRLRQLWDQTQLMLADRFQPLEHGPAQGENDGLPDVTRRCIGAGCPAHFAEVVTKRCESCGSQTQRVNK